MSLKITEPRGIGLSVIVPVEKKLQVLTFRDSHLSNYGVSVAHTYGGCYWYMPHDLGALG